MVEAAGRMFLCARCREPVVLCSRCDRGQRYCGQVCSRAARRDFQRDAGRRYQCGSAGRVKHVERSRRWRERQDEQRAARSEDSGPVTHHGLLQELTGAPGLSSDAKDRAVPTNHGATAQAQWLCPQCAAVLHPWVRQGFLHRRRDAVSRRLTRAGHSPPAAKGDGSPAGNALGGWGR